MSREKDTKYAQKFALSLRKTSRRYWGIRHYFLYTSGKIGLTLCVLPSLFDPLDELGQSQQVHHLKRSATCGEQDAGIG
jgi:hypothetical protein